MKKSDKIIISFFIFLALSYFLFVVISSEGLEDNVFEPVTPKKNTDFTTSQLVDMETDTLFDLMADVESYTDVLPNNISYVKILSSVDNVITAEEELTEAGFKMKLIAKHTFNPYSKHVIEIIDGDAKGTTITQTFESVGAQTNLITDVHLNITGPTSLIAYLPTSNLIHAIHTVNSTFVDYTVLDVYDQKVDALYEEILLRSADKAAHLHWSEMLREGQITEDEIRIALLNSEERYFVQLKSVDELSPETKKIITDLYEKVLLRTPEDEGLKYFGNILENGKTPDEIRTILLESDEGKNISIHHPVRTDIEFAFMDILDRKATDAEVGFYHKMIDDGLMTIDDIIAELQESEEYLKNKEE
tara:strand:+ start:8 stop:1090 length:1083 start_codon:yes stop_codon:yes gene_type:complete